jgi:cyclic pyranopterin phosphate synthase
MTGGLKRTETKKMYMDMKKLTHTDYSGRARMVDIGDKDVVHRVARASGFIKLSDETISLVRDNALIKGDVLTVAEIAGVQAAKVTSRLIPLCHELSLDKVLVVATLEKGGILVTTEVRCTARTGVEMEALTAVSVALLTVYDMCKAVDKNMEIEQVKLIEKKKTPIQV